MQAPPIAATTGLPAPSTMRTTVLRLGSAVDLGVPNSRMSAPPEKARSLPDSPERTRVYQDMARLVVAYAPLKINTHRILTDLWHPHVVGYRRPLVMSQNWWKYIDIEKP